MRILLVTQHFSPEITSCALRMDAFTEAWREEGHDVTVLTAVPNHPEGVIHQGYRGRPVVRERRGSADVVRTFTVVRDGFGLPALYAEIDALDNRIDGQLQLDLYQLVSRLIFVTTGWHLKNDTGTAPLAQRIAQLRQAREALEPKLLALLPEYTRTRIEQKRLELCEAGVPDSLAQRLALADIAEFVPDIALAARQSGADMAAAAKAFFAASEAFRIARIEEALHAISPSDYYDQLALSRAGDLIGAARPGLAVAALAGRGDAADPVAAWLAAGGERIGTIRERLQALTEAGDITVSLREDLTL